MPKEHKKLKTSSGTGKPKSGASKPKTKNVNGAMTAHTGTVLSLVDTSSSSAVAMDVTSDATSSSSSGGPVFGLPLHTDAALTAATLPPLKYDASSPKQTANMFKDPAAKKKPAASSSGAMVLKQATLAVKDGFLQRPDSHGPVSITLYRATSSPYDKVTPVVRPVRVAGFIFPIETSGRPGAPEPVAPFRVSTAKGTKTGPNRAFTQHTGAHSRNTGRADVEKGHLMALELGGPDIPENIVPQWAKFQGCGEWRQIEALLKAKAEEIEHTSGGKNALHFEVTVHYRNVDESMATLNQLAFPVGFTVTATEKLLTDGPDGDKVPDGYQRQWVVNQEQDETDDRLAYRREVAQSIREGVSAVDLVKDTHIADSPAKRLDVVTRLLKSEWTVVHKAEPSEMELAALLDGTIDIYKQKPESLPDFEDFEPPPPKPDSLWREELLGTKLEDYNDTSDEDWVPSEDEDDGSDDGSDDENGDDADDGSAMDTDGAGDGSAMDTDGAGDAGAADTDGADDGGATDMVS